MKSIMLSIFILLSSAAFSYESLAATCKASESTDCRVYSDMKVYLSSFDSMSFEDQSATVGLSHKLGFRDDETLRSASYKKITEGKVRVSFDEDSRGGFFILENGEVEVSFEDYEIGTCTFTCSVMLPDGI